MIDEAYITRLTGQFASVEAQLAATSASADHRKLRKLANEHGRLKHILERADTFFKLKRNVEENKSLIADQSTDPDLRTLAQEEITGLEQQLSSSEEQLTLALLPPDPEDSRNVIVEVRAGTGGEEAALFAADLFRMYSKFAESQGWKVGVIDVSNSSMGGYKEIVFSVEGQDVYGTLKYESGGHRVQRVPATEAQGRIHTSAATVAVLPEVEEDDNIEVPADELRTDIFCSSGPGGQGVNTTYSAVRVTHLPTGIVAQSQDERSQRQNKEKAMRIVLARILDMRRREEAERTAKEKRTMTGSGDRSERIRTYNFPQNRVTDHRVNLTLYNLNRVIDGDLKLLLDPIRKSDAEERMRVEMAAQVAH